MENQVRHQIASFLRSSFIGGVLTLTGAGMLLLFQNFVPVSGVMNPKEPFEFLEVINIGPVKAANCQELLQEVPGLRTGTYTLYPNILQGESIYAYCQVLSKREAKTQFIEVVNCDQTVGLDSSNPDHKICGRHNPVIRALPVSEKASCWRDKTWGINKHGNLWVQGKCAANFAVFLDYIPERL